MENRGSGPLHAALRLVPLAAIVTGDEVLGFRTRPSDVLIQQMEDLSESVRTC